MIYEGKFVVIVSPSNLKKAGWFNSQIMPQFLVVLVVSNKTSIYSNCLVVKNSWKEIENFYWLLKMPNVNKFDEKEW